MGKRRSLSSQPLAVATAFRNWPWAPLPMLRTLMLRPSRPKFAIAPASFLVSVSEPTRSIGFSAAVEVVDAVLWAVFGTVVALSCACDSPGINNSIKKIGFVNN